MRGALWLLLQNQHCCQRESRSRVRCILVSLLNRWQWVLINVVYITAFASGIFLSIIRTVMRTGASVLPEACWSLFSKVAWRVRSSTVASFLQLQYDRIFSSINSDNPSIKILLSNFSLALFRRASEYLEGNWLHDFVKGIMSASASGMTSYNATCRSRSINGRRQMAMKWGNTQSKYCQVSLS